MTDQSIGDCPWFERMSALVDGELRLEEVDLVRAHASTCPICSALGAAEVGVAHVSRAREERPSIVIPDRLTPVIRMGLALAGVVILVASMPDFVRGNTMGETLHDLRHLAIWQASVGVAVLTASVTFRTSRLLATILVTFLLLTTGSVAYDIVTGHRGPWTDTTHIVEVVAVILVMRLVWPHMKLRAHKAIPAVNQQRASSN